MQEDLKINRYTIILIKQMNLKILICISKK